MTSQEGPSAWKTLKDIIPRRDFQDIVDETPGPDECEFPDLPPEPDETTNVPLRRSIGKQTYGPADFKKVHRSSPLGAGDRRQPKVAHFVPPSQPSATSTTRPKPSTHTKPPRTTTSTTSQPPRLPPSPDSPLFETPSPQPDDTYSPSIAPLPDPAEVPDVNLYDDDADGPNSEVHTYKRNEEDNKDMPDMKKPRMDNFVYDLHWVEQLEEEASYEGCQDLLPMIEDDEEHLIFNIDLDFNSRRQQKMFERNLVAFLVKKLNSSEVSLQRPSPADRELFRRAELKEVDSFIKDEAVRRCLSQEEVAEAYGSGRILKARWVLTWKSMSPDERDEAQDSAKTAKARIVLLGYQHPSILDCGVKTSAPVQSTLGRNLLYVLSATHPWELQGLDLATAFLQTQPTNADSRLWTSGVDELKDALNAPCDSVLRILRNILWKHNCTSWIVARPSPRFDFTWSSCRTWRTLLMALVFQE